jgi:D-alanine-D-alanine ligase
MKILVLDKNCTGYESQLAFSYNIYETLLDCGYDCIYHTIRSIADMEKIIETIEFDKIFLCTINDWGNNGVLQKVLDYYKISYTFSDSKVSKLCYDKSLTKEWLKKHKISIPLTYNDDNVKFPCILKINEGESSNGVKYIENIDAIKEYSNTHYFLEEFLDEKNGWLEYTISILNDEVGNPVYIKKNDFIHTPHSNDTIIYDYLDKINVRNLVVNDFNKIFKDMKIKNACRIDFMIKDNNYKILEINSMPIITPNSVFTKSMLDYNKTYNYETILKIIANNI